MHGSMLATGRKEFFRRHRDGTVDNDDRVAVQDRWKGSTACRRVFVVVVRYHLIDERAARDD
jgi:hypothetical protein